MDNYRGEWMCSVTMTVKSTWDKLLQIFHCEIAGHVTFSNKCKNREGVLAKGLKFL